MLSGAGLGLSCVVGLGSEAVGGCCSGSSCLCRPVGWLEEAGLGRETSRGIGHWLLISWAGGHGSEGRDLRASRNSC